ncbi:MAG TPA: tripartite tricarboxylate transporter substrate binding protein [Quisquiliibacterium sp.]|nr:tripartite tricarboxylate transporter substrate binding protein [Quisquiliibacterium sp.]HPA91251.1 tripartite tricarboxylate transporter substrate binding protein [Quisquiliibacterium sp.]HQN13212.1 tripartite tricarboxylate transporter substrate binding protein [Quisquiliibacterium sp.]HQP66402.1 tripartite tricarboxylate transporter substrate binding protein [Quisquiliibacterium sp.]
MTFAHRLLSLGLLLALCLSAGAVRADPFPSRPIRIVVPFAPGGSSEIVARSVAAEMSKTIGANVIVENKPGGAGTIAMSEVAKAAPDGHTLILGHVGTLAVNPYAMSRQPYDVNRDFVPVVLLARVPNIFVVHASVPANNLKEFVALAKAKPGALNYGSAGNGSAGHLAMEYLKLVTGTHIVHIPYRGTGPQLQDLLAGRTEASSAGTPPLLPHVRDGRLKAIAVGMSERIAALPDVGTVAEQGYPGFETSQWYGLIAPAGTPPEVVQKIAQHATQALRSGPITARFANDNALGAGGTPADFARFIQKEQERWSRVVRQADIRLD